MSKKSCYYSTQGNYSCINNRENITEPFYSSTIDTRDSPIDDKKSVRTVDLRTAELDGGIRFDSGTNDKKSVRTVDTTDSGTRLKNFFSTICNGDTFTTISNESSSVQPINCSNIINTISLTNPLSFNINDTINKLSNSNNITSFNFDLYRLNLGQKIFILNSYIEVFNSGFTTWLARHNNQTTKKIVTKIFSENIKIQLFLSFPSGEFSISDPIPYLIDKMRPFGVTKAQINIIIDENAPINIIGKLTITNLTNEEKNILTTLQRTDYFNPALFSAQIKCTLNWGPIR